MTTTILTSCVRPQGEIRATAFNEQVDKFFPLLDVNKVCSAESRAETVEDEGSPIP